MPEEELSKHGLVADATGACTNLLPDNSCEIYEERPDICRVDVQAKQSDVDVDTYYRENIRLCNDWMDEDGMSNLKIEL
jgi:Fe-S-cluster containining protein